MKAVIKILNAINTNLLSSNQVRFHKSYGSWRYPQKKQHNLPRIERTPPF